MALHTGKALLVFSRINISSLGVASPGSRVTYATALSINPAEKKGLPDRSSRGPLSRRPRRDAGEPRTQKMAEDQDWMSVYPSATPFRPGSVPLPVRMGYPVNRGVPPEKKGNLELIKVPNFLHLTPGAIKKHCQALKPFCNEWPSTLDTDAECDRHFPVKVETTDYVSAGLSIRNPSARVVHLRVALSSLNLDDHARKKMARLAGERYNKDDDTLRITTDRCPLREQNYDYAMYLLTVLYHESWKTEAWEAEKTAADMEEYSWEGSRSQRSILDTLARAEGGGEEARQRLLARDDVQEYGGAVTRMKNQGASESGTLQYKDAVKKLLKL